jgi:hypothetical protein
VCERCRRLQVVRTIFSLEFSAAGHGNAPLHLIATAKNDSRLVGARVPVRRCDVRPAIVTYAVTLTQRTIAMRHPRSWDHDVYVAAANMSSRLLDAPLHWAEVLAMLYPFVAVNCTYQPFLRRENRQPSFSVGRFVDCDRVNATASNTSCSAKNQGSSRIALRDSSLLLLSGKGSTEISCDSTWRDPMPVSNVPGLCIVCP